MCARFAAAGFCPAWPLEADHLDRRTADGRDQGALCVRRRDVFEGAINGQRFRAYIEQMLAPTLMPGDIVLLDNLRSHKVAGIAEAIAAREAQLI